VYEAQDLLGCTAVFLIEYRPTFHTRRRENLKSHFVSVCWTGNGVWDRVL